MDRYSKTVLTLIAIALLWISIRDVNVISDALASSGVIEVKVVDFNLSQYRPLPVEVQGEINCKGR